MTYSFIKVDRDDAVTTITLHRPEVLNALHPPAHFELEHAFDRFAADPDQWVAVLTGAGDRAFSAGQDLKGQAQGGGKNMPRSGFAGLTSRFDLTKPLIAAVNGIAMGGGFEMALACDIILASKTAVFALPEPRVGLAALAGGVHRLPRAIGTQRAMHIILTARSVSAAEGRELGFVNAVTRPEDLLEEARSLARRICELGPLSIRASKQAVYRGLDESSLEAAIAGQNAYPAVAALFASEDFKEGPLAFAQKRAPNWQAR